MVSWDDVLFGVLTGGAYNAVKAAAQAGDAAGKVGDDIGKSVAITTEKALALVDEVTAFVIDLEQLMVVKRLTKRDENDLWDEDKERLKTLRDLETIYVNLYIQYGGKDTSEGTLVTSIVNMMMSGGSPVLGSFAIQIRIIRKAIDDILYNEPGVIPETIYQVKAVIERFNTLEQPRIETLMDTTTDTIQETNEILVEMKKLFIIRQYKEKAFANLSSGDKALHVHLTARRALYDDLITKNTSLSDSLHKGLAELRISGPVIPSMGAKPILPRITPGDVIAGNGVAQVIKTRAGIPAGGNLATVNAQVNNSPVVALLGAGNFVEGRITFYERERLKSDKALFRLTHEVVEIPGVIPNTLEEVHLTILRFRTEEQPRIEKIMDSSNEMILETKVVLQSVGQTVLESKKLLAQINADLNKTQGWFDLLSTYRIPLMIACGFVALLVVAIMVMVLVVLVKMAFF